MSISAPLRMRFAPGVKGSTGTPGATGAPGAPGSPGADGSSTGGYVPGGRITSTTGVAITSSDVASATTIYYTPHITQWLPYYNGTSVVFSSFTQLSLALDSNAGHSGYQQSGKNFDVFAERTTGSWRIGTGPTWNAGAVAGSDIVRGTGAASTELELKLGLWTNKNSITLRYGSNSGDTVVVSANQATYLGTIRTIADGATCDTLAKRFIWNAYNPVERLMRVNDATVSWTYAGPTFVFRQARSTTTNQLDFVIGLAGTTVRSRAHAIAKNSTTTPRAAMTDIGVDSTSVPACHLSGFVSCTSTAAVSVWAEYMSNSLLGRHFLAWLESGEHASETLTFFGTASGSYNTGISGTVWG